MKRFSHHLMFLLCIFECQRATAQDLQWKSSLPPVQQSGFYSIPLPAQWLAITQPSLADIRIKDEQNKQVPFIISTEVSDAPAFFMHTAIVEKRSDSTDGYSYLWLHQAADWPIDSLLIAITSPQYFIREAFLFSGKKQKEKMVLAREVLQSGRSTSFCLNGMKQQDVVLAIRNGDNPPLYLASFNFYCRRKQLITYLQADKTYTLMGGNPNSTAPFYDLALFRDSIPHQLSQLVPGTITANSYKPAGKPGNTWLWPTIAVVLVVLLIITFQLLKEIIKKPA